MRSRELFRLWSERPGAGDGKVDLFAEGGALLALRAAPSLAAEDKGVLGPRAGDFDAASRAAIPEADARDEVEGRPLTVNVLAGGDCGPVNLPILSLTVPTSGPNSDPVRWRLSG